MRKQLKLCIIGRGVHAKRIQKILKLKKIKYNTYVPNSKKNFLKENISHLKKYKIFFIVSPNNTHIHYLKNLSKNSYIFCEKPPVNSKKDLAFIKKINSKKIFYNFNFRFSKIAQILKNTNKYNLGKLIYFNIISGHGLALKKTVYKKNWRSNKKFCAKGVFEMAAIHWIDLINYIFEKVSFTKPNLYNISKIGNSFDNSVVKAKIKERIVGEIFTSYTSPLISKKIFIFSNGVIEQDENQIVVRGPALNLNKDKFFIKPKIIKKFNIEENLDYYNSLKNSIEYFLTKANKNFKFSDHETKVSLQTNQLIL
jgi:hypothetical protein